jgi:hypothetical protein
MGKDNGGTYEILHVIFILKLFCKRKIIFVFIASSTWCTLHLDN